VCFRWRFARGEDVPLSPCVDAERDEVLIVAERVLVQQEHRPLSMMKASLAERLECLHSGAYESVRICPHH
jgi:hypothetical protein